MGLPQHKASVPPCWGRAGGDAPSPWHVLTAALWVWDAGPCTGDEHVVEAKHWVVFPTQYLPLHPFLDYRFSVGQTGRQGVFLCDNPSRRVRSQLFFPAPHPLTAELRRNQLPHLFIYQSVMSAEDAFEALLVISLTGKEILHILVFDSF